MSFQATNWALDVELTTTSAKIVLLVLAIRTDDRGSCFPSVKNLCRVCHLTENTVRAACVELEQAGHLFRAKRFRKDGGTSSNEYMLLFDELTRSYAASRGWKDANQMDSGSGDAAVQHPEQKGHRLPKDWRPGDALIAFAIGLGFTQEQVLGGLLDEFADYWRAVPGAKGRKLDWDATFRNNLRKTQERMARRGRARPEPKRNPLFEDLVSSVPPFAQPSQRPAPRTDTLVHHLEGLGAPRLRRLC